MSNHASLDDDIHVPLPHVDQLSEEEDGETPLHKQLSQQPSASVLSPDQLPQQDQTYDTLDPVKGGFTRLILFAVTVSTVDFRQNWRGVHTTDIQPRYYIILRNKLLHTLQCDATTTRKM